MLSYHWFQIVRSGIFQEQLTIFENDISNKTEKKEGFFQAIEDPTNLTSRDPTDT